LYCEVNKYLLNLINDWKNELSYEIFGEGIIIPSYKEDYELREGKFPATYTVGLTWALSLLNPSPMVLHLLRTSWSSFALPR
jgi:hypothetical protein